MTSKFVRFILQPVTTKSTPKITFILSAVERKAFTLKVKAAFLSYSPFVLCIFWCLEFYQHKLRDMISLHGGEM